MKNEIKIFKIMILLFLTIAIFLVCLNYFMIKDILFKKSINATSSKVSEAKAEKYGYSDILDLICEDENIEVDFISNSTGKDETVKLNIDYKGNIQELYYTLNSFSKEKNFYKVENITLKRDSLREKITLTIAFIKNK